MEIPTQTFREVMNLVFQLIEELQIKIKTVMSIGASERKKECFSFVTFTLSEGIFFIICVFSQYIAYSINFMISYQTEASQPLATKNI